MTRLFLVDAHAAFRQALSIALTQEYDVAVTAEAASIPEALRHPADADIAIVDVDLEQPEDVQAIKRLHTCRPGCAVLVFTEHASDEKLALAVEAGAAGVLCKTMSFGDIVTSIRRLAAGEPLLSPVEVIRMLRVASQYRESQRAAEQALHSLTEDEREVLQALAEGLNDTEIAQRLSISAETACNHITRILKKLGVESRLQALLFALRQRVVDVRA
jgi:RNA polymerase sigma factor (sigma-70 family)